MCKAAWDLELVFKKQKFKSKNKNLGKKNTFSSQSGPTTQSVTWKQLHEYVYKYILTGRESEYVRPTNHPIYKESTTVRKHSTKIAST